ncbi:hypothetical protein OPV22_035115 [Ensete ventricosum]|uniref:Uncharacterized protein n=1 Tax=Ensete ventricosum TaxID=4639 RepID=A0AAX5KDN0_ENSVE|nr:hypothetical protein OPV22_035115 [Ensete ventricosum]
MQGNDGSRARCAPRKRVLRQHRRRKCDELARSSEDRVQGIPFPFFSYLSFWKLSGSLPCLLREEAKVQKRM